MKSKWTMTKKILLFYSISVVCYGDEGKLNVMKEIRKENSGQGNRKKEIEVRNKKRNI